MIAFFADNHFGARPGFHLHEKIRDNYSIEFREDDLTDLPGLLSRDDCRMLVMNWISDTGDNPHPGPEIEVPLKTYLQSGRPLLLVHGGSAAFSNWSWWRELVGLRWVRENDPDGFSPSTHPVRPYSVKVAKTSHPLAGELEPFDLPTDEIYTELEQTCPITVIMETTTTEGTFPQAYVARSPWGGKIAGFIPGHCPEAFESPALIKNIRAIMDWLA
jgi:hypothetical protein